VISARLVVLDIGATLVSGPASRIAAALRLDHQRKRALRAALMTTPFRGPGEVARLRVLNGDAPAPSRTIRSIAELGADVVALRRRGPPDAAPRPVHARSRSAS
jgi:hypothetical protein